MPSKAKGPACLCLPGASVEGMNHHGQYSFSFFFFLYMYVSHGCSGSCGGQKGPFDFLELELLVVVSYLLWVQEEQQVLLTSELSLQPCNYFFFSLGKEVAWPLQLERELFNGCKPACALYTVLNVF